ncbi:MAG: tetratricopeptide repeat protein [Acidobacteria bacterium]|nr:tetratricopeptide repeat protein [Acidobacteriota bacterium]
MSACRRRKVIFGSVLLLAIAFAGASARLQVSIDREKSQYEEATEMLWIPSGEVLRKLSLGHEGLLADIYWTRVVQYFGGKLRDRQYNFNLLAPLLNITVTLDPHLLVAYYFGAFFLSAQPPQGAGQPQEAVALLQRGIEANPQEWRLWHHLGFLYYWELQDYGKAAAAYEEGSKNPNARPWMKVMAAAILQKGGNREISRFLWTEIYNSSEDVTIRENARVHLESLKALDDIVALENRARLFREQTGRWPQSFSEMIAKGLLGGAPSDPQGFPYQLQAEGKVGLDPQSPVRLDYGPSPL